MKEGGEKRGVEFITEVRSVGGGEREVRSGQRGETGATRTCTRGEQQVDSWRSSRRGGRLACAANAAAAASTGPPASRQQEAAERRGHHE